MVKNEEIINVNSAVFLIDGTMVGKSKFAEIKGAKTLKIFKEKVLEGMKNGLFFDLSKKRLVNLKKCLPLINASDLEIKVNLCGENSNEKLKNDNDLEELYAKLEKKVRNCAKAVKLTVIYRGTK